MPGDLSQLLLDTLKLPIQIGEDDIHPALGDSDDSVARMVRIPLERIPALLDETKNPRVAKLLGELAALRGGIRFPLHRGRLYKTETGEEISVQ